MFKKKLIAVVMSITMISVGSFSYAHSGRTDSSGGHRDNKNKSGLGSYHYHCGGYPAHLHNNGGCPYTGGGSSSGATTSSVNNEEKQKKSVGEKGYNQGYEDGYKGNYSSSSYSGDYSDTYESKYSEGYEKGKAKLEEEKRTAKEAGYNLGLTGVKSNNTYEKEALKNAYDTGYSTGYNEYKTKKIEEYKAKGIEDSNKDKEKMTFEENIDSEFIDAYNNAYDEIQEQLKNDYTTQGFESAIKGEKFDTSTIGNVKYANWFKEGYDNGKVKLPKVKESVYNQGYNEEDFSVPDEMKSIETKLKGVYDEGLEKREEEKSRNATYGVGAGTAAVVAGVVYKKKKRKKI
ncbi:TPA: YHYH domain-containing protein [Clostridioides difficile]|uniref:YHYH domain-containing protein n=2 Tax=Clostridioides difficile TaxID=1496 RepID=UPI00097FE9DF|nr:YHYH domain-containing protein [Clostridioides difficile]EGT3659633.1 YHYH domain-containing protein [Clostridioides difficile]EGT5488423.1 YHYH domain-containing protein [Clostridioides difficile]MBH7261535.1 YHYH domain-containing protein [Clostridioides difficile]MCL6820268.1 YHYH domain-containing protein [Clostridioides difficile]MDL5147381.1 YHYH domain-containing protein [Clostridioides difficile]